MVRHNVMWSLSPPLSQTFSLLGSSLYINATASVALLAPSPITALLLYIQSLCVTVEIPLVSPPKHYYCFIGRNKKWSKRWKVETLTAAAWRVGRHLSPLLLELGVLDLLVDAVLVLTASQRA